jgi:hypothetical protein
LARLIAENDQQLKADPFIKELQNRFEFFQKLCKHIDEAKGKLLLHSNVVLIKVSSLELVALLHSYFRGEYVDLKNGFYAVSNAILPLITSTAKKKGFYPKVQELKSS